MGKAEALRLVLLLAISAPIENDREDERALAVEIVAEMLKDMSGE